MHTMAAGIAPISVAVPAAAGNRLKPCYPSSQFLQMPVPRRQRNFPRHGTTPNFSIRAQYNDSRGGSDSRGGGGVDFLAGFLLGSAIVGALAYVYSPQLKRILLNENEHGFRRTSGPIYYYDNGPEIEMRKTRKILIDKMRQLTSAIDNVFSRLRGGINKRPVPVDPEEATV